MELQEVLFKYPSVRITNFKQKSWEKSKRDANKQATFILGVTVVNTKVTNVLNALINTNI